MEARQPKGLCYNCDEVYTRGHRCKRLFMLEGIEEVVDALQIIEDGGKDMELSIHAISRTKSAQTMQMKGYVGALPLKILIDSSRTHCFIHHTVAESLHLSISPTPTTNVTVANGKRLQCLVICKQVLLHLSHAEFLVHFFVIPLGSFSVVLEVNWLRTLGSIHANKYLKCF